MFDFFKIKNFFFCVKDLVVFIELIESKRIIKSASADEFIFLLKKMEAAHIVFIFEQESLCL